MRAAVERAIEFVGLVGMLAVIIGLGVAFGM